MLYEFKNSLMKQLLCLISGNKKKGSYLSYKLLFSIQYGCALDMSACSDVQSC